MITAARPVAEVLLALVLLTACGTGVAQAPTAISRTTATSTAPAPAPAGALHVVHTPATVVDDMHLKPGQCHARGTTPATGLPDPACTPGAIDPAVTQANIKQTICKQGYTSTIRPSQALTGPVKRTSMTQYGVTTGNELDHLVPLELGGASATSNLWPEIGPIPNPKDAVENNLRARVCAGQLTLAKAQAEIAADWTTAR